jgi:3-hydroxyacyl-CoA dehydrogenase
MSISLPTDVDQRPVLVIGAGTLGARIALMLAAGGLKRRVLGELDRAADPDAILGTNSSSYPSSQMIDEVEHPERVLNIHSLMPPDVNPVELMSCGRTDDAVIGALMERLPRYGLVPFRVLQRLRSVDAKAISTPRALTVPGICGE